MQALCRTWMGREEIKGEGLGSEPQEQEVGKEQRLVACPGSAFRSTAVVWLQHSKT